MVRVQTPKTPAPIQMLQWVLNPTEYANTNFQRFGDCYQAAVLPMNPEPLIFLNHPEAIQYLLTKDSSDVLTAPGEANALAEPLLGKNSVILASGKQHRRQRQLLMPPFHGERMKAYGTLICQITQELIDEWPIGEARCTRQLMQTITMRVILQAIFGLYESDRYRRLEKLLGERLDLVSTPLTSMIIFLPQLNVDLGPWSLGGKIRQVAAEIDELIYAEIQERRANFDPDRTDVLSLLLSARDEQGAGLTDEELHDELMTLLVAGHETTATALTWALYWIHQLPEVQRKLIAELEPWKDSSDLTAIARLPYLKAVCNETLRIYPVALLTLPRRVEQPITLMGRDLENRFAINGLHLFRSPSSRTVSRARTVPTRTLSRATILSLRICSLWRWGPSLYWRSAGDV